MIRGNDQCFTDSRISEVRDKDGKVLAAVFTDHWESLPNLANPARCMTKSTDPTACLRRVDEMDTRDNGALPW